MVELHRAELAKRLGKNIAASRKALGLTQEQVALRLGVEPETISRIERGMTTPSLPTLERIAHTIGVTIAALLGEEPILAKRDYAEQLAAKLEPLGEEERALIMDIIERMSGYLEKADYARKRAMANNDRLD